MFNNYLITSLFFNNISFFMEILTIGFLNIQCTTSIFYFFIMQIYILFSQIYYSYILLMYWRQNYQIFLIKI